MRDRQSLLRLQGCDAWAEEQATKGSDRIVRLCSNCSPNVLIERFLTNCRHGLPIEMAVGAIEQINAFCHRERPFDCDNVPYIRR